MCWQGLAVLQPLSQNIAKIVQRICSIIVTIYLFDKHISVVNRNGMILAFFGVGMYCYISSGKKSVAKSTCYRANLTRAKIITWMPENLQFNIL